MRSSPGLPLKSLPLKALRTEDLVHLSLSLSLSLCLSLPPRLCAFFLYVCLFTLFLLSSRSLLFLCNLFLEPMQPSWLIFSMTHSYFCDFLNKFCLYLSLEQNFFLSHNSSTEIAKPRFNNILVPFATNKLTMHSLLEGHI